MEFSMKAAEPFIRQKCQPHERKGFERTHDHIYTNAAGKALYCKIRLKNKETGEKKILPVSLDANGQWQMKEPDFDSIYPEGNGLKPFYGRHLLEDNNASVYAFEGEQKVDLAHKLGFVAITTGGSNTVNSHDLAPLANRNIILWRDNDEPGEQWQVAILKQLAEIPGVDVQVVDVDKLGLPAKGDIVDYVDTLYADGEDDVSIREKIKNLPILADEQVSELLPMLAPSNISQNTRLESAVTYKNGYIESHSDGLFFVVYDDDEVVKYKNFICSPLTIVARTRDEHGKNWGIWLRWHDREGRQHELAMPIEMLQGDSREYRKLLASSGLVISTTPIARECLDAYLNTHPTTDIALCVDKTGWHGDQYLTPNRVFGTGQKIIFQSDHALSTHYQEQGSLAEWQQLVSVRIVNQYRVIFGVCCAFTGPLLPIVNEQAGGFHFVGSSTKGKSLTAKLACSVWGHPKTYMHTWNTTSNAIENTAYQHNHGLLVLDEINLANPSTIGDIAYMMSEGKGKDRMGKTGNNRKTLFWQTCLLSTGEETLEAIQSQVGKHTKAGQLVRFISLDAVYDENLGIFDSLIDGFTTPAEQANALLAAADQYYGTAGIAWLEYLTEHKEAVTVKAKALIEAFLQPYAKLSSQAQRVGRLFAVVATAGELASQANIAGWPSGHAIQAARICFDNWLSNYGGDGDHEEQQILKQVRAFIQLHGESRFANWASDGVFQKTNNRVGFYRSDYQAYLFFRDGFEEVCRPFTVKTVIKVLQKHKLIRTNEPKRDTFKVSMKGDIRDGRYYYISADILSYEPEDPHK